MTKNEQGQSLIEILVGLAIGALLIGAAVVGIVFVLRSGSINQSSETAAALGRDLLLRARSVTDANWFSVYSLPKGPDIPYYVSASGTEFAVVAGSEGVATDVPTAGLRGQWGFDELSGDLIHNALPNGVSGQAFGTTHVASCRVGGCRAFNGSGDSVLFGNNTVFDFLNSFTISLWMRPALLPSFPDTGLLSKGGLRYGLTYHTDGSVRFYVKDGTNYTRAFASPGTWHHVSGVFDADASPARLILYIDGAEAATSTSAFSSSGAEGDLVVGRYNSNYFSGEIDDVRLYDRALSPFEVRALYGTPAFTRYVTFANVYRDPSGGIMQDGGAEDPSTQELNVRVSWISSGNSQAHFDLKDYVTRWRNQIFRQTDWSAGVESLDPLSEPGGGYSNSMNVQFLPGEIRLNEL